MAKTIEHLTDKDFLVSKDGIQHPTLGKRIENVEKELNPLKVRYVRDWMNGCKSTVNSHWVEIQAFEKGENVALGKGITSSFIPTVNYNDNPKAVTDGVIDTAYYYQNNGGGLVNVIVDLGKTYEISEVKVWHYYKDSRFYYDTKTEVSEDGINWVVIFDSAVEGTYVETSEGKTHKVNPINPLNTTIKNNIKEINEIRNRLNELQLFYDVSLLEVDYTLTKEKFEYVMATMLGE